MKRILLFILFICSVNLFIFASDTLMYDNGTVGYSYASGIYHWGVLFGNDRLFSQETALVNITGAHASLRSLNVYTDSISTPLTLLYSTSFIAQNR